MFRTLYLFATSTGTLIISISYIDCLFHSIPLQPARTRYLATTWYLSRSVKDVIGLSKFLFQTFCGITAWSGIILYQTLLQAHVAGGIGLPVPEDVMVGDPPSTEDPGAVEPLSGAEGSSLEDEVIAFPADGILSMGE